MIWLLQLSRFHFKAAGNSVYCKHEVLCLLCVGMSNVRRALLDEAKAEFWPGILCHIVANLMCSEQEGNSFLPLLDPSNWSLKQCFSTLAAVRCVDFNSNNFPANMLGKIAKIEKHRFRVYYSWFRKYNRTVKISIQLKAKLPTIFVILHFDVKWHTIVS